MTTAYRGFLLGAKDANHDVSSLSEPFGFRPKTWPVPVFPLTSIGNPANTPAPVPLTTTSRSAPCKNLIVDGAAVSVPSLIGSNVLTTVPSVLTIAFAIFACQMVPPLPIAAYICSNFRGVTTVSPCPIAKLTASPARILSPSTQFSAANCNKNGVC